MKNKTRRSRIQYKTKPQNPERATKPRESVLYRRLDLPLRSVCMAIDSALPITSPFACANLNFRMFPAPTCLLTQSIVHEIDRRYLI